MKPSRLVWLGIILVGVPYMMINIQSDYEEFGEIQFPDKVNYFQLALTVITIIGVIFIRRNLDKNYKVIRK
jgi:hypothetical protein